MESALSEGFRFPICLRLSNLKAVIGRACVGNAGRAGARLSRRGVVSLLFSTWLTATVSHAPLSDSSNAIITATIHSLQARLDMLGSRHPRPVNCPRLNNTQSLSLLDTLPSGFEHDSTQVSRPSMSLESDMCMADIGNPCYFVQTQASPPRVPVDRHGMCSRQEKKPTSRYGTKVCMPPCT